MDCLLGIDLGTSYFKFALVDRSGAVRGAARRPVPVSAPLPGRQEVDPAAFLRTLREGIAGAALEAAIRPRDILGLSYSSQANSFLLLDRDGHPLTPIVLWSDHRVERTAASLEALWNRADYLSATGMEIRDRELAIAKIDWFRRTEPSTWERAAKVLTLSDYLTFLLTGTYAGDESTGSLLGMWDVGKKRWWQDALEAVELRAEQLAVLQPPGTRCGETIPRAAAELGLSPGVPFAVGSLDHYAAAVGAGLGRHADTSESTGTVLACVHLHPAYEPAPSCCTAPTAAPGSYYRLAFGPNGARRLELFQRRFAADQTLEELSRLAGKSSPGAGGVFAPQTLAEPLSLDEFRVPSASGPSVGDYVRAVMESSARSLSDLLVAAGAGVKPRRILATGGGARSDVWLQIKADMLGCEVAASSVEEPGSFGAALFASVAARWHRDIGEAIENFVKLDRFFTPDPASRRLYKHLLEEWALIEP